MRNLFLACCLVRLLRKFNQIILPLKLSMFVIVPNQLAKTLNLSQVKQTVRSIHVRWINPFHTRLNVLTLYSDPNIVSETDLELHSSHEFFLSDIEWENNLLVINAACIVKLSGNRTNCFSLEMSSIFPHCC